MRSLPQRFGEKVELIPFSTCWHWIGAEYRNGYGKIRVGDKMELAHRVAYEIAHGAIPAGKEIDHLCRTKNCVRVSHLEAVSHKENCQRSAHLNSAILARRAKTHCPQGHRYSGWNLRRYGGGRYCRTCGRLAARRQRARLREERQRCAM